MSLRPLTGISASLTGSLVQGELGEVAQSPSPYGD